LTGQETLYLLGSIHGKVDVKYQAELIERFQFDPSKKVRTYSKGNRQKINIIAALMTRADLLMMDEPTSGLDPIMEQAFRESALEAKANGQTIFLSSHILEEVEALCDRVAILQAGKLVELGTLEQMRHLSALTVEATFTNTPPKVDHLKGVSGVKVVGHQLICQIQGPIDPLLSVLADAHPKTLLSREPSLEELFLSLYGDKEVRNKDIK
jgi:ABC-2 type transport system ATP-binding protein